ncbi:MAG TPA: hypothetical protein VKG26_05690, partial [Bacteroidia bacterium]|nr:hypothetical protein [Bacteroidia bacterium]
MNKRDTTQENSTLWSVDAIESIDFIQQANFEAFKNTVQGMIGNSYDASKVYVLWGCVNSGSGSNYNISAGAVFYNGEVYTVDATSFTATGTAVGTLTETDNGVGILFSDNMTRKILKVRKFVIADGASGSGTSGTNGDFANFRPIVTPRVALYQGIADYTFYGGTHTTA